MAKMNLLDGADGEHLPKREKKWRVWLLLRMTHDGKKPKGLIQGLVGITRGSPPIITAQGMELVTSQQLNFSDDE